MKMLPGWRIAAFAATLLLALAPFSMAQTTVIRSGLKPPADMIGPLNGQNGCYQSTYPIARTSIVHSGTQPVESDAAGKLVENLALHAVTQVGGVATIEATSIRARRELRRTGFRWPYLEIPANSLRIFWWTTDRPMANPNYPVGLQQGVRGG